MEFGSDLEQVFAIFTNLLDADEANKVTNDELATHRAAQWIRSGCDPGFIVEPPFEEWELELH